MRKYRLVAKKGEGTFSEVLKAQNVKNGTYHAIKCMKNRFESIDQVNNLREIQALRRLSPNEHIITLEEVLYDPPTGRLALVFELMDGNLYEIIRGRKHYLNPQLIKGYMWQLMKSLDHMHKKGIFHRDIKPENILIESSAEFGQGLKLADLGSCRGIYSKQPYTEYISTRWYRAPECLLTDGYYGPEMDMWGAGCVMFEITTLFPLFPGKNEADQIARIHKIIGTKTDAIAKLKGKGASHINFNFPHEKGSGITEHLKHASPEAVDLIHRMLKYDSSERMTAREAMVHPYFKEMKEFDAKKKRESQQAAAAASTTGQFTESMAHKAPAQGATLNQNQNHQQQQQQQQQQPSPNKYASPQQILAAKAASLAEGQHKHHDPKQLPHINGNAHSNKELHAEKHIHESPLKQQQHKNMQHVSKHYNGYHAGASVNAGASNSLPPITGGSTVLPAVALKGSNHSIDAHYKSPTNKNSNIGGIIGGLSTGGSGNTHSSNHPPNANATQKKRKKYRLNYGNSGGQGQVMKAYGVNGGGSTNESPRGNNKYGGHKKY